MRHIKNEHTQAIEIENLDPADIPRLKIHFKEMKSGDHNTTHTQGYVYKDTHKSQSTKAHPVKK